MWSSSDDNTTNRTRTFWANLGSIRFHRDFDPLLLSKTLLGVLLYDSQLFQILSLRPERGPDGEVRVELDADEDPHIGAVQEPPHAAVQDRGTNRQPGLVGKSNDH